jgi:hypothetical protein
VTDRPPPDQPTGAKNPVSAPVADSWKGKVVPPPSRAEWMYERLARAFAEFEEKLDDDKEVALRLVSFSERDLIHVDDVGYWSPDLIVFKGKNSNGDPVELYQHVSQISVLLVASKKMSAEAKRIGYVLLNKIPEKQRLTDPPYSEVKMPWKTELP